MIAEWRVKDWCAADSRSGCAVSGLGIGKRLATNRRSSAVRTTRPRMNADEREDTGKREGRQETDNNRPAWHPAIPGADPAGWRWCHLGRLRPNCRLRSDRWLITICRRFQMGPQMPAHDGFPGQLVYGKGWCVHKPLVGADEPERWEVLLDPPPVVHQCVGIGRPV